MSKQNKNISIKKSDLITEEGKLTNIGAITFIYMTSLIIEKACKEFNRYLERTNDNL